MKQKYILSVLSAAVMAFCLAGCQKGDDEQTRAESLQAAAAIASEQSEQTSAESIQAAEADVFEITDGSIKDKNDDANVLNYNSLIKFEDGDYYGYKDSDGNIVVPAKYYIPNYFRNPDMTGMAVEIDNALYYIDKDGTIFLKMDDNLVIYSDFYNGFAFYDGRFIDEQGNTVYEDIHTRSMDRIRYWGNGYFENYSFGNPPHVCFTDANGNEKISNCNVSVSQLTDGYAVVDMGIWSVLINSDLEVKAIFLNTIECMPNNRFVGLFYDYIEDKNFLKIKKGFQPVTKPYDFNEIDEIKRIFENDCDLENVAVYIFDGDQTETDPDSWDRDDYDEYDIEDISSIINIY